MGPSTKRPRMLRRIAETLLELLLPRRPDIRKLEAMSAAELAAALAPADETPDPRFRALCRYRAEPAKTAIWEIKYRGNARLAAVFAALLSERMIADLEDDALFAGTRDPVLVTVPASRERLRAYGFDQCALLARELERIDGGRHFSAAPGALARTRETPRQARTARRTARFANLAGSFRADPAAVRGRSVVILDDVITTGATMHEAARACRAAGARNVIGYALAH